MYRSAKVVAFLTLLCAVVLWGVIYQVRPKPARVYDGVRQMAVESIDDAMQTVDAETETGVHLALAGRFINSANEDAKALHRLGQLTAFCMAVSSVLMIWMLSSSHQKDHLSDQPKA